MTSAGRPDAGETRCPAPHATLVAAELAGRPSREC